MSSVTVLVMTTVSPVSSQVLVVVTVVVLRRFGGRGGGAIAAALALGSTGGISSASDTAGLKLAPDTPLALETQMAILLLSLLVAVVC